ncbi:receptor-type tyrosine-protein phosphatase beta-like [Watersipora subatra]|uniref:receptor-type tyrosine-protein phosphatase beta-like n=1 Tax=Watersipora subatra TaxID=2589382 RepID=UPI00355C95BE
MVVLKKRKDRLGGESPKFMSRTDSPTWSGDNTETDEQEQPAPVSQKDFVAHTENMHKDQNFLFSEEYQTLLRMSPKNRHNAAVLEPNTSKNRWVDILPFDHSRVKLLPAEEEIGSDYINANYMPGFMSRREYIATQGPLPGTIDHFWRMVWEQNVSTIVMLTQLIEKNRRKCEQYWPDEVDEGSAYGDLVVTLVSTSILPEYTIRIFDVQMKDAKRTVKHFSVSFWPDFGCPEETSSLLNLVRVVRSHLKPEPRGPLVVHCSAGVGRTGTYIAVDRLLQEIQENDEIDIFAMVLEMRDYRCKMVQTEDQYVYIHDCLKAALLSNLSARYKVTPENRESSATRTSDDETSSLMDHTYENHPAGLEEVMLTPMGGSELNENKEDDSEMRSEL